MDGRRGPTTRPVFHQGGTGKKVFTRGIQYVIIPPQCFYRFFGNFDWSVGKMKWFLHFNKTPCV